MVSFGRAAFAAAAAVIATAAPAASEPVLKIINITAEWCPNCHLFEPQLAAALRGYSSDDVEVVNLDLTILRTDGKATAYAKAADLAERHRAGAFWRRYEGVTGLAGIVAADTGELMICLHKGFDAADIADFLDQAHILALRREPGRRMPDGPWCPE